MARRKGNLKELRTVLLISFFALALMRLTGILLVAILWQKGLLIYYVIHEQPFKEAPNCKCDRLLLLEVKGRLGALSI